MDDKLNALDRLIEAVEAGVDDVNWFPISGHSAAKWGYCQRAYEGSLDAALALHDALLSNRYWKLEEWDGAWTAEIPFSALIKHEATDEHSPARAWLLAVLKAYRSVQA